MKEKTKNLLKELLERYPILKINKRELVKALDLFLECYNRGKKILICGNGGSAADSEHISGELLKGFMQKRVCSTEDMNKFAKFGEEGEYLSKNLQRGIKAIPLPSLSSSITAYLNDAEPDLIYAQLTYALGDEGDILLPISTSGNSRNTYYAVITAKTMGMKTIALTGKSGGKLNAICDVCIKVRETETFKVQELHLPVYHFLCAALEEELFGEV